MTLEPLDPNRVSYLVGAALAEDLGGVGDITSNSILPPGIRWHGALNARRAGVIAGLDLAAEAFRQVDPSTSFEPLVGDGTHVEAGMALAKVAGPARSILTAERVALNFLGHLSGIASLTGAFVDAVKPAAARICCTRKTTPLLRDIEKYAVRAGGGVNQRFGLFDAVLIKDNHIAAAGSIRDAVMRARGAVGDRMFLQLEVDSLDQLAEALTLPLQSVLLDNMSLTDLAEAVRLVGGRFMTEASGGVRLETVGAIAATGVDRISVGAVTHSAPVLDIGLDEA